MNGAGPVLFARYAYGPNRLGLCGPDDWVALRDMAADGTDDRGLRELARGFEGAYPYLTLLAGEAGIGDPLDRRVVAAYWRGSPLPAAVGPRALGRSLDERFASRLSAHEARWLGRLPGWGAQPDHAFHVFSVFPRLGLMRGETVGDPLALMDACRIRWGHVIEVTPTGALVASPGLELADGRLQIGAARPQKVRAPLDGADSMDLQPGDLVALHWDWVCERLDGRGLAALVASTQREMELASRVI